MHRSASGLPSCALTHAPHPSSILPPHYALAISRSRCMALSELSSPDRRLTPPIPSKLSFDRRPRQPTRRSARTQIFALFRLSQVRLITNYVYAHFTHHSSDQAFGYLALQMPQCPLFPIHAFLPHPAQCRPSLLFDVRFCCLYWNPGSPIFPGSVINSSEDDST
ncbi:hypothetical protein BOTBODRAFT_182106 [Botryobasidium botryosum FD-172 SS1]|uniref:Uncharacterized protein n=1 Tax=Botryobasidium botryosum (strain FD-172 SS1) TaxID=930990 RepID=A0A067M227_BOTB1|nr:hypothetical protein BOTBODRAFT_182106 [Botryobasidium botryosum FD-172 SS1]